MALADVIINDGQAVPVAHTFQFITMQNGKVVRSDITAGVETPLLYTIGHALRKDPKFGIIQSHLDRFDVSVLDADGITVYPVNIRVMCDIPNAVYSDALVKNLAAYVRNRQTEAWALLWTKGSNA